MAAESDERRVSPAYRLVHHYREQAVAAIQRYNEYSVRGQTSTTIQRDLASAALNFYNVLYEYRDEDALDEPWDERGVQWLEEAANRTVETEVKLPRPNGATTTRAKPMLMEVDPRRLVHTIRELNDIANELGFSARIQESTTRTEITDELFEDVKEWHQRQT